MTAVAGLPAGSGSADRAALQKIKVVNQPVRPADSAGPFQRFIAAASTLPGLARGPDDAERGGVKSTPNPAKQANSAQRP